MVFGFMCFFRGWHGWMVIEPFTKIRALLDTYVTLTLTVFMGHRLSFVNRFAKDLLLCWYHHLENIGYFTFGRKVNVLDSIILVIRPRETNTFDFSRPLR